MTSDMTTRAKDDYYSREWSHPTLPKLNRSKTMLFINLPTVNSVYYGNGIRHGNSVIPTRRHASVDPARLPVDIARSRAMTSLVRRPSLEELTPATTQVDLQRASFDGGIGSLNGFSIGSGSGSNGIGSSSDTITSTSHIQSQPLVEMHHDQMKYLSEEVNRLSIFEYTCKQKDDTISQLRDEIATLQRLLRQTEVSLTDDTDGQKKMLQLEARRIENQSYSTDQQKAYSRSSDAVRQNSFQFGNGMENDVHNLTELHRDYLTKEKNSTIGLISKMQHDMKNKDLMIGCLAKETKEQKRELLNKELEIVALKACMCYGREEEQEQEEQEQDQRGRTKEREIAVLNHKLKVVENEKEKSYHLINLLKNELVQTKAYLEIKRTVANKNRLEMETLKSKCEDVQRAERLVRIALEQLSKRLERLRSCAIQTAYCAPGAKVPEKQIGDDDLLAALKKCADERVELSKKIKLLESRSNATERRGSSAKLKQTNDVVTESGVKKK